VGGNTHLCRVVELVHRGTLTGEAGYVEDDETGGQKPPSEPRASCPSLSSDGHGSCKPRVPHLTPLPSSSPPPHSPPMASSSTRSPDQPQYSAYTNVWQPNQRTPYVHPTPLPPPPARERRADRILSFPLPAPPSMSPGRLSP
jgi:hypothetical protein